MEEVYPDLFIGDQDDCFYEQKEDWAVIHACKEPCYDMQLQYQGDLPEDHPEYLMYIRNNHLYLNYPNPITPFVEEKIFNEASYFIHESLQSFKVLVHSRSAVSRAPALVLVYLAASDKIANETYEKAAAAFTELYPAYDPSPGMEQYLSNNWNEIFRDE